MNRYEPEEMVGRITRRRRWDRRYTIRQAEPARTGPTARQVGLALVGAFLAIAVCYIGFLLLVTYR